MADTQPAPQPAVPDDSALDGSLTAAQDALLKMMEPETETPESEEAQPTDVEESQPEEEGESFEEESEEALEEESEEDESEEVTEESDEESEEAPLYAVTINGEEREVSLEELTKGYSRQSDYTKKTQDLAAKRKEAEDVHKQMSLQVEYLQAERQEYINALSQVVQNSMVGLQDYQNIDWETLRQEDPITYVTKKEEEREAKERVQQMIGQQQAAQAQEESHQKARFVEHKQEETRKLVDALPAWSDPTKRAKLSSELREYAVSQGFTENDIKGLVDHRQVVTLYKASKYDKLQGSDIKQKKTKNKPKVIRSGTLKTKSETSKEKRKVQMKRLQQTGHVDDAAALLEDMFNPN